MALVLAILFALCSGQPFQMLVMTDDYSQLLFCSIDVDIGSSASVKYLLAVQRTIFTPWANVATQISRSGVVVFPGDVLDHADHLYSYDVVSNVFSASRHGVNDTDGYIRAIAYSSANQVVVLEAPAFSKNGSLTILRAGDPSDGLDKTPLSWGSLESEKETLAVGPRGQMFCDGSFVILLFESYYCSFDFADSSLPAFRGEYPAALGETVLLGLFPYRGNYPGIPYSPTNYSKALPQLWLIASDDGRAFVYLWDPNDAALLVSMPSPPNTHTRSVMLFDTTFVFLDMSLDGRSNAIYSWDFSIPNSTQWIKTPIPYNSNCPMEFNQVSWMISL